MLCEQQGPLRNPASEPPATPTGLTPLVGTLPPCLPYFPTPYSLFYQQTHGASPTPKLFAVYSLLRLAKF